MAATAQINARISPELKRTGDAALEQAGITATQYIRLMWEFAAKHKQIPTELREEQEALCETDEDSATSPEGLAQDTARKERIKAQLELVREGAKIYTRHFKKQGLPVPSKELTDDDLLALKEEHLQERYGNAI